MSRWQKSVNQRTFIYCPICDKELIGSHSFVHDKPDDVRYKCIRCGCESSWNFDIAPAPILMKHQKLTGKMQNAQNITSIKRKALKK